jgi:hypothetical protein
LAKRIFFIFLSSYLFLRITICRLTNTGNLVKSAMKMDQPIVRKGGGLFMKKLWSLLGRSFIVVVVCLPIGTNADAQSAEEFWALQVGNSWTYNSRQDTVANTDASTFFPLTTYVLATSGGTGQFSSWYSIDQSEIREWQEAGFDPDLGPFSMRLQDGIVWARNPIKVGEHWTTVSSGTIGVAGRIGAFTLSLDVTVLSQEPVTLTLPDRTYQAYKYQHTLTASANGTADSATNYFWFVPYLGIVKRQADTGETETLTSTNVTVSRMFLDVPSTHFARTFVEQLATAGITSGCAAGPPQQYCPENVVTRGQMAVFIETFLGNPANNCAGRFGDVPASNPFCGFIERLADDGITGGCGGNNFCPDDPVTRGQMAVLVEAALGHTANTCTNQFNDVDLQNPFCGFIERLAADGISSGCGGGNFCPNDPVTRAQMAVFLATAPAPLSP